MAENTGSPLLRRHLPSYKLDSNFTETSLLNSPRKINSSKSQYDLNSEKESDESDCEGGTKTVYKEIFAENLVIKNKIQACTRKISTKEKQSSSSRRSSSANLAVEAKPNKRNRWQLASLIVLIVGVGLAYYFYSRNINLKARDETENYAIEIFERQLNSLQGKFPNFNKKSWKTILAVVRTTLSRKPSKTPGVITIMAPTNGKKSANCLGKKLANLLQTAFNDSDFVNLKGEAYSDQEPSKAKLKMDVAIRDGFERKNQHVVLFENFQAIPPASSTLFHGLCDNENAPFKQVIYIFTVENNNAENLRDETITTVWTDQLDVDILSSLESRIGNNVVVVNREANTDEESVCN